MSTSTYNYLFIFHSNDIESTTLQQKIRNYQMTMDRMKKIKTMTLQWHIVYVAPKIPSYAMYSPAMVQVAEEEKQRSLIILKNLGRIFDIPETQLYLRDGNPNVQAKYLAKDLGIQKVIGYSKSYLATKRKLLRWQRKFSLMEGKLLRSIGLSRLNEVTTPMTSIANKQI